jgi:hypothetical protein
MGGIPPPKMVPFFHKNSQVRQLRLNLSLGQGQIEREQPSGKDAGVGDSLRHQQDTALLPRLWTSGPLVKSKLSTSDLPKSRKEQRNGVTSETKSFTYITETSQVKNCTLHGHEARMLTFKKKSSTPGGLQA